MIELSTIFLFLFNFSSIVFLRTVVKFISSLLSINPIKMELSKFMDPLKLIPTLRQINSAIQSFIKVAQKVQNIINLGQFLIKLTLLLVKVFRFLLYYFGILPIPMLYLTYGAQSKISDVKDAAKDNVSGLARVLNGLNALLSITTIFVRYLLTNKNSHLSPKDSNHCYHYKQCQHLG